MTVDASEPVAREDHPDGTDPVEALGDRSRALPPSAFSADSPHAGECGIYSWWADEPARRLIGEALGEDALADLPIYVGKTEQTFTDRLLGNHLNGTGRSTFRVTLAAILMTVPAFAAEHPNPRSSSRSSKLSEWMRKHLAVSIVAVDLGELAEAERAVIARYDPPLNLSGLPGTPARAELKRLRKSVDPRRK